MVFVVAYHNKFVAHILPNKVVVAKLDLVSDRVSARILP